MRLPSWRVVASRLSRLRPKKPTSAALADLSLYIGVVSLFAAFWLSLGHWAALFFLGLLLVGLFGYRPFIVLMRDGLHTIDDEANE